MKSTSGIPPRKGRSFRNLSRNFLKSEMHQHFVTEAVLFALIFAVSAWPMLSLAEAMATAFR
jgi:hypothetical protein